ncbi:MAG TPA: PriCT-2 domain-containing protein [Gemmataceae bacterium]|jgi:hypothetical protein|nr:PriCT-2 domain-containing protein [Gemmataceae bacterium]
MNGERNGKSSHAGSQSFTDDKPNSDRVSSALKYIREADNYDRWIAVGQCLHSWDASEGYRLWLEWSRQSNKYNEADCLRRWRSFTADGGLTIGTLFQLAGQGGWRNGPIATWGKNGTNKEKSGDSGAPTRDTKADTKPKTGWTWDLIDSATFDKGDYRLDWHVKRLIVRGENLTIAGAIKTMKTTIAIDLAVSLGTETKFLGQFDTNKAKVAILSGESGNQRFKARFAGFAVLAAWNLPTRTFNGVSLCRALATRLTWWSWPRE